MSSEIFWNTTTPSGRQWHGPQAVVVTVRRQAGEIYLLRPLTRRGPERSLSRMALVASSNAYRVHQRRLRQRPGSSGRLNLSGRRKGFAALFSRAPTSPLWVENQNRNSASTLFVSHTSSSSSICLRVLRDSARRASRASSRERFEAKQTNFTKSFSMPRIFSALRRYVNGSHSL